MASSAKDQCPRCNQPLGRQAVICTNCGFDRRTGARHTVEASGKGGAAKRRRGVGARIVAVVLTFVLTALGIIGVALALAEEKGAGYGLAAAVVPYLLLNLWRLGYDWDDGIDIRMMFFPSPYDWSMKYESFVNFFTMDRPFFRAAYLGGFLAMIVVGALLVKDL